jgi:hypothetical protein
MYHEEHSIVVKHSFMRETVVTMSNVLQRGKDDWLVIKSIYSLEDDHIDISNRITSTEYEIDNRKDLPEDSLKQGALVEGHVTPKGKFYITNVK